MKGIYTSAAFSDATGLAVAPLATVEVRREDTNALATLYADKDGTTPLANSFLADSHGVFAFYADGIEQGYKVTVTLGGFSQILRNQPLGNARYFDASAYFATLFPAADAGALANLLLLRYKLELIERAARRARLYAAQNLV